MNPSLRASVLIIALLAIGLLGGAVARLKPKIFHGESRRAEASTQATAAVESTTAKVDASTQSRGAAAAASVVAIAHANSQAPESPAKNFIAQEAPAALANLPAPDPVALLEAEKRRSAVMEGRATEARALYEAEAQRSATLQHERDTALAERDAATIQRRKADADISEAAAAHLAMERQQAMAIAVIVLLGIAVAYVKLTHLSPASIGKLATDLRSNVNPIEALSSITPPWIHDRVQAAVKLATTLDQPAAK